MTDENEAPDPEGTSVYRIKINAPIETVWSTLVKTDEVLPFFFGAVCRTKDGLKPGAAMTMQTKDGKYASVVGRVLEFSPPHRYAHTMKFTQWDDPPVTVIYELKELAIEGGTEFTLTTIGAIPGSKTAKSMAQGSSYIAKTLKEVAEKGRASVGTRMMLWMFERMAFMAPKQSRAENWPEDKILNL